MIIYSKLDECCESGYTTFPTLSRTITLLPSLEGLGAVYVSHSFSTPFAVALNSVDDWCIFNYYLIIIFIFFLTVLRYIFTVPS